MNTSELIDVPTRRLGRLLTESRERKGRTMEYIAQTNVVGLTYTELTDIEAGRRPIDGELLETLVALYGVETSELVPERTRLVIDLDEKMLITDSGSVGIEHVDDVRHVLTRYLGLVYILRDVEVGESVPLREADMEVLAGALAKPIDEVKSSLRSMMTPTNAEVTDEANQIRSRRLLPVAGIVLGATAVGTIIAVGSTAEEADANPRGAEAISEMTAPGMPSVQAPITGVEDFLPPSDSVSSTQAPVWLGDAVLIPAAVTERQNPGDTPVITER
jgi:transcriptional regulator with XRE-family HTH domain